MLDAKWRLVAVTVAGLALVGGAYAADQLPKGPVVTTSKIGGFPMTIDGWTAAGEATVTIGGGCRGQCSGYAQWKWADTKHTKVSITFTSWGSSSGTFSVQ